MTTLDFQQYLLSVAIRKSNHPEWRMGQAYFNVLRDTHPEIAEIFRGTNADPFHNDALIGKFLSDLYDYNVR